VQLDSQPAWLRVGESRVCGGLAPGAHGWSGLSWIGPATAPRAAVGFLTNNAPHALHRSAVGFPISMAARGSDRARHLQHDRDIMMFVVFIVSE